MRVTKPGNGRDFTIRLHVHFTMPSRLLGGAVGWAVGLFASLALATVGRGDADSAPVRLTDLQCICLPAETNDAERSSAEVLRKRLRELYGVELAVMHDMPKADQAAVFLGRRMTIASGLITAEELNAVKHDGFVIKGSGHRVALAGYAPQGTIYATYAFLRHAGLKLYPWRSFDAVEIRQPVAGGVMEAFSIASKPFFDRRDLLGYLDQGRWGASLAEYSLGEFRALQDHEYFKGKGWLGGDHTAAFLVPMAKYHDQHPEYYALRDGRRLPKDTENARVALCLSNPDVHHIAAERAIEWMASQNQRRFFHITDGDTRECACPECLANDPEPGSCTDRNLKWVNSVARAVKPQYPENVLMALAYMSTTRPPLATRPESNVVVLYCPWYWNSRTTSAVGWASPLNLTAMKEFTAWTMRFPGQVGLYDYPDSWVFGQAERLKFLAKRGVRVFYACGGNGDLYQWVNARLLWDPLLDTEDLVEEFVHAYYGPAAEPMREYARLQQATIARRMVHTHEPFRDAQFLKESAELIGRMEQAAEAADERTQVRILASALEIRQLVLRHTHPQSTSSELRQDAVSYRAEFEQYEKLSERVAGLYERLGNAYAARTHRREVEETLQSLRPPETPGTSPITHQPQLRNTAFGSLDEAARWLSDGSRAELIAPPETASLACPSGERFAGIRIRAPLARLPVTSHDKRQIHAGRFYAERIFDPPVDASQCPFLDFHVHASCDVPITIYVNDLHSDVDLHAGEQIVRVDLRNFDLKGRFSYADWDKQVRRISFDIWPQDNYPPFPTASDTELTVFSLIAGNQSPQPARLPHSGRALWLSQFRANLPRGVALPRTLYDQYLQRQRYKHVGLDYGARWISERFRTFTAHRAVSPIFTILVAPDASPAERQAAELLQRALELSHGIRLPVQSADDRVASGNGNAILIGRQLCVQAGRVTEDELRYVGPGGFVINVTHGRIALAGADDAGTTQGVIRYLEDHGLRFFEPERVTLPDRRDDFLHELYLPDWPHFRPQFAQLAASSPVWLPGDPTRVARPPATPAAADIATARMVAQAIKHAARSGRQDLPELVLQSASRTSLSRFLAARLLWDPWADASHLIREFPWSADETAARFHHSRCRARRSLRVQR